MQSQPRSNAVVIIPSLNPEEKFLQLLDRFTTYFTDVIVVDDGSQESAKHVFDKAREINGVHVLTHEQNQGKGSALKTAYKYYKTSGLYKNYLGVITADSDGQHEFEDVRMLDEKLYEDHTYAMHIGYRDLNSPSMPARSKFGNKITAFAFNFLYSVKLKDTQTGLRAFSNDIIDWMIAVKGERFEYEMNVLIKSKNANFDIYEHPIATHYEPDHKSTFRTFKDAFRVMKVLFGGIFKFVLSAILAGVVDIGAFAVLYYLALPSFSMPISVDLLIATVVSRALSSVINFIFNRYVTFGGKEISRKSILKYYVLWLVQMTASYGIVTGLTYLFGGGTLIIKLLVDLTLSIASYRIQQTIVFAKKKEKSNHNKL